MTDRDPNIELIDQVSPSHWDDSYNLATDPNLWGEKPVPYVQTAIKTFHQRGASTVLDFPCGDGRNTLELARIFPTVVGADSSRRAMKIAQAVLAAKDQRQVVFLEANLFGSPFLDNQFDAVFCWDVIGHLKEPAPALKEMLRICRPSGMVITSIFALGDSTRGIGMKTVGPEEYVFLDKFFYRFYDEDGIRRLVSECGGQLHDLQLVTWDEPPHEGFRPYPHTHQSWAVTLIKEG